MPDERAFRYLIPYDDGLVTRSPRRGLSESSQADFGAFGFGHELAEVGVIDLLKDWSLGPTELWALRQTPAVVMGARTI
jgi:hypothetical protein